MRQRASKVNESSILKMWIDTLEPLVAQRKLQYIRHHPVRLVTSKGKTFPVPVNPSQRGAPDLIIFLRRECWLVETKAPRGKLSPEQTEWLGWFMRVPGPTCYRYFMPSTVKEASTMIDVLLSVAGMN